MAAARSLGSIQAFSRKFQVLFFVRRDAAALCLPQRFAKSLHQGMLRLVPGAKPNLQLTVQSADSRRPINGQLLAHRKMQSHVQEGILLARAARFEVDGCLFAFDADHGSHPARAPRIPPVREVACRLARCAIRGCVDVLRHEAAIQQTSHDRVLQIHMRA